MVIDTCTYIGHWPFRKLSCETLSQTAARAEKAKITHMICTNLNAIFYIDGMEGNRELLEEVHNYHGNVKVLPFAVINPAYIEWERDLRECAELGFVGIQLAPQYHGYSLMEPCAAKAYNIAGELGLAVKIDVGFENVRQRSPLDTFRDVSSEEIAKLISTDNKPVTIISSTYLKESAGFGLTDAVLEAAKKRDNVFFNAIYADCFTAGTLEDHLNQYTSKRLCFGTMCPFRYIEPQYVKLFGSGTIKEEPCQDILYKNLQGRIKGL